MVDLLRGLGIGIVSLLGIAVPGALLLGLVVFGALPLVLLPLNIAGAPVPTDAQWPEPATWMAFLGFAGLSYIAGYILRLNSPNGLDLASAKRRRKAHLGSRVGFPRESKAPPERFALSDHYPYWGLKEYLDGVVGPNHPCAQLVEWDASRPARCDTTFVNMWKKDVELFCPTLASGIRSEEAHIRLMSGTWLAIRASRAPVLLGLLAAASVLTAHLFDRLHPWFRHWSTDAGLMGVYFVVAIFVGLGMRWGQTRIEELFHPRRVGELLLILHAKVHADRIARGTTDWPQASAALAPETES